MSRLRNAQTVCLSAVAKFISCRLRVGRFCYLNLHDVDPAEMAQEWEAAESEVEGEVEGDGHEQPAEA